MSSTARVEQGSMIPASPGWRVCVWSREQGGVIALEIVAWDVEHYTHSGSSYFIEGQRLRPWVLTEFGEQVEPLGDYTWFVAIMPPGSELIDFVEAGEAVAKAEEEAEERAQ